jgi:hypothetical protein
MYAAIDIHKHAFQAAVLDPETGDVAEERFSADRESLARWAEQWQGRVETLTRRLPIEEDEPVEHRCAACGYLDGVKFSGYALAL